MDFTLLFLATGSWCALAWLGIDQWTARHSQRKMKVSPGPTDEYGERS